MQSRGGKTSNCRLLAKENNKSFTLKAVTWGSDRSWWNSIEENWIFFSISFLSFEWQWKPLPSFPTGPRRLNKSNDFLRHAPVWPSESRFRNAPFCLFFFIFYPFFPSCFYTTSWQERQSCSIHLNGSFPMACVASHKAGRTGTESSLRSTWIDRRELLRLISRSQTFGSLDLNWKYAAKVTKQQKTSSAPSLRLLGCFLCTQKDMARRLSERTLFTHKSRSASGYPLGKRHPRCFVEAIITRQLAWWKSCS